MTVERDLRYREHGVLRVGPENIHRMSVDLATSNENALKIASWGTARDLALVDRLNGSHESLEKYLKSYRLRMFQGYIAGKPRRPGQRIRERRKPVPAELRDMPCLTGGNLPPFRIDVFSVASIPRREA